MKFLTTADTMAEIRNLLNGGNPVRAAVAYWGADAITNLGITADMDLEIVCDVLSGGCSPDEIRKLIKLLGKEHVLTYDRIHSKVWMGPGAAIVGSSNASSNGLGFEGKEALTLAEANVLLDDQQVLADLQEWWTGTIRKNARTITPADLRKAGELRGKHRLARPTRPFPDLLAGLMAEPEVFAGRNLFVWVYEHGTFSNWVDGAMETVRTEFSDPEIECWQDIEAPPPPGSYVIDFNSEYDPPLGPTFWRVLDGQPTHKTSQGTLLLAKEVAEFDGMKLGTKRAWRAAAAKAAADGRSTEWDASDFAERFMGATDG